VASSCPFLHALQRRERNNTNKANEEFGVPPEKYLASISF